MASIIPNTLAAWTLKSIEALLAAKVFEDHLFDWKEKLPDSRNDDQKERLADACAAFANTNGGFLIFGVKDDRNLTTSERLVGMSASFDFPEAFGSYLSKAEPRILGMHSNPAIVLESGNLIHVVEIPRSHLGPHGINRSERWHFPIRTSQGVQSMTYDEIRVRFSSEYERRAKLRFLVYELESLAIEATSTKINRGLWASQPAEVLFDLRLVEQLLSETFIIISADKFLLDQITKVRQAARQAERVYHARKYAFEGAAVSPMVREGANQQIEDSCNTIIELVPKIAARINELT